VAVNKNRHPFLFFIFKQAYFNTGNNETGRTFHLTKYAFLETGEL